MTPDAEERVLRTLGEVKADTEGINKRLDILNGSVARLKEKEHERSIREAEARGLADGLSQAVVTRKQLATLAGAMGAIVTVVQVGIQAIT